ncbi:MAG: radical SAM protein [Pseudomonadota bacterium]|mgnify:CR=1 FL=1
MYAQHDASMRWHEILARIEGLEDIPFDLDVVNILQTQARATHSNRPIQFHTPTFKHFHTAEIAACNKHAWPAISITGGRCKLQCDHCKAKILEPMHAAPTPADLWRVVNEQIAHGAQGMLLTGGSNHRNEVEYAPFYHTVRRIKDAFPMFRIAAHTALMDADSARAMQDAGVDVAMLDVIGAQQTITQVYHLRRGVEDFERTLENLLMTRMRVVPHIVLGLHYGEFLGEPEALEIVRRHLPSALVLVVAMPYYANPKRPYRIPNITEIAAFFRLARMRLPQIPLLLGCARPAGIVKAQIDAYAVMAGLDGVAHPSEGVVELAMRLGRHVRVTPTCCSIVDGAEVGLQLEVDALLSTQGRLGRLKEIKIVME